MRSELTPSVRTGCFRLAMALILFPSVSFFKHVVIREGDPRSTAIRLSLRRSRVADQAH